LDVESLTERQERILDFVVREYVDKANPVGSKTIVELCNLGVSSATVRAEMAQLETLGYLTHPHTSAGRLPTARGYRYFVENLMRETALPLSERRMIEHQFHQVDRDLEQWIKLAGAILTSKADTASLVTAPRVRRPRFKRLDLVRLSDSNVLLLVMLSDGTIRRRIISLSATSVPATLQAVADELDALLLDLTSEQVRASFSRLTGAHATVGEQVAGLMDDVDLSRDLELHRYGFANILRQPEFTATEKLERVMSILEEPGHLEAILGEIALAHSGVQVIIGGEERWPSMSDFSLILARYGVAWRTTGVVGLMGPIRMPYSRNVPMVSYVAELMSRLVQERRV
jgi:heat-inducible transcriptional repressor